MSIFFLLKNDAIFCDCYRSYCKVLRILMIYLDDRCTPPYLHSHMVIIYFYNSVLQ